MRIEVLDRSVEYGHFSAVEPDFARVRTPDWLVYLLTRENGFNALVTADHSQLEQEEELIALSLSGVNLVTWKGQQEDPVVQWGQLLAYMPQILPHLLRGKQTIIRLPNPRLKVREHVFTAADFLAPIKIRDKVSYPERRAAALEIMHDELARRGRLDLERHLKERRKIRVPSRAVRPSRRRS
jgi:hypothetical protein